MINEAGDVLFDQGVAEWYQTLRIPRELVSNEYELDKIPRDLHLVFSSSLRLDDCFAILKCRDIVKLKNARGYEPKICLKLQTNFDTINWIFCQLSNVYSDRKHATLA